MSSTAPRGRGECKYDYDGVEIGGHDGIGDYNHDHDGDIYVDHIHADSDHDVDDIKIRNKRFLICTHHCNALSHLDRIE